MLLALLFLGQAVQVQIKDQLIAGPAKAADFPAWLSQMKAWRTSEQAKIHYKATQYEEPRLKWAQSSFIQPQMMVEDRYFYDPVARTYTVAKYLQDLKRRYGGIDSVLVWPTYPNIGIDDRNTDDMMRSMPGGIPGLKRMVTEFHKQGVKVLLPIHPWDVGTREPGAPWATILPSTMAAIGADGLNGDTMTAVTLDYFERSKAVGDPLALEPEIGLQNELAPIAWNTMSWGYWDLGSMEPKVSVNKWLEPRHMVNICDRWSNDKTDLLQYAFFNGAGVETWENVWGIWNQLTDRDAETVRRISTLERAFKKLLVSPGWEPHTPMFQAGTVFASKWPSADGRQILWTIVNRGNDFIFGRQMEVPNPDRYRFYDLWHGKEISPKVAVDTGVLSFEIEQHGYGAILALARSAGPEDPGEPEPTSLLAAMRRSARQTLSSFSNKNIVLAQQITPIEPTTKADKAPDGMIRMPGAQYEFAVKGIEIEGEDRPGVDVQYPWESQPVRAHKHTVAIDPFYIDKYPVTNDQFKAFMDATHYQPSDPDNFLKDWRGGACPDGWGKKPVTWVSIEDARAYASWAGKRLPHEWEWQYAAQGTDGRAYPWGNAFDLTQVPTPNKSRLNQPPFDVDASSVASPFGVRDLVGNVWQWTDEYADEHTRAAILKGGSRFQPQGSMWYFPQAYRLDEHGKYLLMAPCKDRSANIGFRCVVDAAGSV